MASHKMNPPLYSLVDDFFSNKSANGIRVYEFPKKIANMDVGTTVFDPSIFQNTFFCTSERSLAACSIPTTYEGEGVCGACFGQSARYLTPDMRKNGLILDAEAAKILHTLGVDVGIESLGTPESTTVEHFIDDGEVVVICGTKVFNHKFKDAVRVCSNAEASIGSMALSHMRSDNFTLIPMPYLYENEAGERYFVINFDTRYITKTDNTLSIRHYKRSQQYVQFIPWLSRGKQLPAYCFGHSHLYLMTEEDGVMAVGLWNFFADLIVEPVIELDREYQQIRFLNCNGKLSGKTVMLTNIAAHSFAAFEVKSRLDMESCVDRSCGRICIILPNGNRICGSGDPPRLSCQNGTDRFLLSACSQLLRRSVFERADLNHADLGACTTCRCTGVGQL
ncbi:MAG: hypothetical protein IJW55_10245 [Clostridia bacterium]|nr:hypothetical protein [Clostridia bacterium]MBQ7348328.1 hypothetical protein [Clostridia bacterium]